MSQLAELLEKVKDDKLPLELCEKYRDALIHYKTSIHIEVADLKKKRAIFLTTSPIQGLEARKLAFDATEEGLRLIDLKGYLGGLTDEISGLQNRIYGWLRLQG